ncbi:MAG TPA: ABC transporter ATP-binding protein [Tepidisphaeraceae bacterium]|nr:ABC transporter ATP-binding protein [Tepidisphaeraceae bacterium]
MIDVRDLHKTYEDPDGGTIAAVNGATFNCNAGEIFGLLGPNGAGKTTTLRCLATILTPTSGTAMVAGFDLRTQAQNVRRQIGFLSSTTGLYGRLTPRETLRFFGRLNGMQGQRLQERLDAVLKSLKIEDYADRPIDRLSTGMKQRVGLARALVHDPPVLILDEPTTGLDPIVSRVVEEAVQELAAAGKCILFSTHLLDQAEAICHRLGIIGSGKILAQGTVAQLKERTGAEHLRDAFFRIIEEGACASPS